MIWFIGYAILVWVNWGLVYSDLTGRWGRGEWQRRDSAMALLIALIPLSWLLLPFITGFYEDGWRNPFK
jgi:hypothetical protein